MLSLEYDQRLMSRLYQLGMTNWASLLQKSGLTPSRLRQVRCGELGLLTLNELIQLARALDWTIEELLQNFGIENTSSTKQSSQIAALQSQCLLLFEEMQDIVVESKNEFRKSTFEQLRTLLIAYPNILHKVNLEPDYPVKSMISLFTCLENLIESWGYEQIGQVWEQVPYNPQLHQPDVRDIQVGELVYVRFVGYREGEKILCRALVSRTLPGKNSY